MAFTLFLLRLTSRVGDINDSPFFPGGESWLLTNSAVLGSLAFEVPNGFSAEAELGAGMLRPESSGGQVSECSSPDPRHFASSRPAIRER